jgi:membrane associated rhomboid family serine protease
MMQSCYRHPNRATGASCTRCGRPICADCMVEAPVGHHCPDCVREGNRGVRQVHWRPSPTVGGRRATPVVRTLIAVNVIVFLVTSTRPSVELRFAQVPIFIARGQYERLLTAAFLHAGILHIVFNMMALYIIGPPLEEAVGRVRFTTLYLLAALGGSVLSYLFSNPVVEGVGASGAIFGLFGAFFVIARTRRADTSGIMALIAINLVFSFVDTQIDWRAHVGGLVIGTAVAAAFALAETRPPSQRRAIEAAVAAVVLVLLVGLTVLRTDQLRTLT